MTGSTVTVHTIQITLYYKRKSKKNLCQNTLKYSNTNSY